MWYLIAPALTTKKLVLGLYGPIVALFVALTFTAEGATALAVAVTALVAAIFTGTVNIIVALQTKAKNEENSKKTDSLLSQTAQIKTNTDGTLTRMETALALAEQQNLSLRELITSMTAAALDKTAAVTEAGKLSPPP